MDIDPSSANFCLILNNLLSRMQSSQNLFSATGQLSGTLQVFAGQNPIM